MSGWIKWEKDLETDPRVLRMIGEMKRMSNAPALHERAYVTLVCGGLLRLWSYADTHIRDDDTLDLGIVEIDELIGIDGFCSLMPSDWLKQIDEKRVELPGFQQHNGVEARKTALTQKRVEKHRKRNSVTDALTTALPDQTRPDQDQKKKEVADAPPPFDPASIPKLDLEAWRLWVEHRKAIRKPIRPHSLPDAAEELVKLGDRQLAEVKRARAGGWQGLHPEEAKQPRTAQPEAPRARAFPS